jgi:hypothetical protein
MQAQGAVIQGYCLIPDSAVLHPGYLLCHKSNSLYNNIFNLINKIWIHSSVR